MNLPSLLTFYRLVAAPVAVWMAFEGHRDGFFILIIISLFTDLIDGPLARWLGQETRFGAKLDTVADSCTLLVGLLGLYLFEVQNLRPEFPWIFLFLVSYAAAALASVFKFGVLPAYHLYSSKTAAFCTALFFIWLFLADYSRAFLLLVIGLGVVANLESLLVTLRLKRFRTDIVSLFTANIHSDENET